MNKHGFSLIESLVVMALVAILLLLMQPMGRTQTYQRLEGHMLAAQVQAEIDYARELAICRGERTDLYLSGDPAAVLIHSGQQTDRVLYLPPAWSSPRDLNFHFTRTGGLGGRRAQRVYYTHQDNQDQIIITFQIGEGKIYSVYQPN